MSEFVDLHRGDPAPWFHQRNPDNPNYAVDSTAGRYLVFCFFGSAADESARMAITSAMARPDLFDDRKCSFFSVSTDLADAAQARVKERYPGYRCFWDFDLTVSRLYGAAPRTSPATAQTSCYRRFWVVLDPLMRVLATIPFDGDGGDDSGSPLHTGIPITRGRRYVFLPFLYDDAAAKIREENNRFLAQGIEAYSSTTSGPAQT